MDDIDPEEARRILDEAQRARQDAERPAQSVALHLVSALAVGLGVVALAQLPGHRVGHLVMLAIGVVLIAVGGTLPVLARRRAGVRGYRGVTRNDHLVFLVVAAVLVVCALQATSTTAIIYLVLGLAAAVEYFLVLRRHPSVVRR